MIMNVKRHFTKAALFFISRTLDLFRFIMFVRLQGLLQLNEYCVLVVHFIIYYITYLRIIEVFDFTL